MLIYLASPYTDPDPAIRERRAKEACCVAADLIRRGYHVLAPIGFFHYIHLCGDIVAEWSFWANLDQDILSRCDELWVIAMQGWQVSTGVNAEIIFARKLGIPVYLLDPKTCERVRL